MRSVTRERSPWAAAALAALLVVAAAPAGADLRITNLDVSFTDHRPTVNLARLDAIAPGCHDPTEVVCVRVKAQTALNGHTSFVTRMAGTAEQTVRQSEYRTLLRVP